MEDGSTEQKMMTPTITCAVSAAFSRRRFLSSSSLRGGALAGGFSKESLQVWAAEHFANDKATDGGQVKRRRRRIQDESDESDLPYADMFHQSISHESSKWLESHSSPSDALGRAFFSCRSFAPERFILSTALALSSSNATSRQPKQFNEGERYLVWNVASKSPLELILTWEIETLGLYKGVTQLSFDPNIRRVYQGNALESIPDWAQPLLPAHEQYAQYLLRGMVEEIGLMASAEETEK